MVPILAVSFLIIGLQLGFVEASLDLEVPSNVHNRSMSIKGTLFCGNKPFEGAKVRLFRVYQKNAADDLAQLLDQKQTYVTGMFQVEGNTGRFPSSQTEIEPYVTIHHTCGQDEKVTANKGYKRFAVRLPADYVTLGFKARKVYDFGRVNLELGYPGETHDKKFDFNA